MRERLYRWLLALADVLAMALTLASIDLLSDSDIAISTQLALPLVVIVGKLAGLYDRDELVLRKSTLDEVPRLLEATGLFSLLIWLIQDVALGAYITGGHVLWLWGAGVVATFGLRAAARVGARKIAPNERCLVIGDRETIAHVRRKVDESQTRAQVVAAVALDEGDGWLAVHDPRTFTRVVEETDADRVIIAPVNTDAAETLDLIKIGKAIGVRVSVLPRVFEVVGSSIELDEVDGMIMMGVRRFGLSRSNRAVKRALDLVGGVTLLLLLAPVIALTALAVKLDSRGPVFFRQVRVGRDGRRFRIFKFRTMVPEAEALKKQLLAANEADGGLFKIADDPRVTRVGRFLRRTSLDELPQLFNVVRGEMALVGPRPLVVDEDSKVEGLDRARLHLTPGMTGHWQILGSARIPMHEMVGIDYLYVANWSLWQDIKILVRTVPYMLRRRGM